MSEMRNVSSNPHVRDNWTTRKIMMVVAASLLIPAGYGVYSFGLNALIMLILSVASCVATEYIYEKAMHKVVTIGDFSAVVTGLLLGMNLPAQTIIGTVAGNDGKKVLYMGGLWLPIIGGIFAILVVKMVFGGLGQNFMNPALGARCFLLISFPVWMNHFMPMANDTMVDATTTATPLTALKAGQTAGNLMEMLGKTHISEMVTGKGIGGVIGETSMIAIVIGACILILAGIIDLRIPGSYIVTFVIFLLLFGPDKSTQYITAQLAGGGLMLGAFYMATDYTTSPITKKGKYIYGMILGILTGVFRVAGASGEGVSYAIIIGNLTVPLIERFTIPRAFGIRKEAKKA